MQSSEAFGIFRVEGLCKVKVTSTAKLFELELQRPDFTVEFAARALAFVTCVEQKVDSLINSDDERSEMRAKVLDATVRYVAGQLSDDTFAQGYNVQPNSEKIDRYRMGAVKNTIQYFTKIAKTIKQEKDSNSREDFVVGFQKWIFDRIRAVEEQRQIEERTMYWIEKTTDGRVSKYLPQNQYPYIENIGYIANVPVFTD